MWWELDFKHNKLPGLLWKVSLWFFYQAPQASPTSGISLLRENEFAVSQYGIPAFITTEILCQGPARKLSP